MTLLELLAEAGKRIPNRIEMSPGSFIEVDCTLDPEKAAACYNTGNNTIYFASNLPPEGKLEGLIHEVLHAIEQMMIDQKQLQEDVNHENGIVQVPDRTCEDCRCARKVEI